MNSLVKRQHCSGRLEGKSMEVVLRILCIAMSNRVLRVIHHHCPVTNLTAAWLAVRLDTFKPRFQRTLKREYHCATVSFAGSRVNGIETAGFGGIIRQHASAKQD